MKKKLIAVFVMLTMTMALMPFTVANAKDITGIESLSDNITLTNESYEVQSGSATLDLAGYTLTATGNSAIVVHDGATLTIIDSSSLHTGKVVAKDDGCAAVAVLQGGTVNIQAGSFEAQWYVIKNFGTVTISNAKFTSTTTATGTSMIDNGWYDDDANDTINGTIYSESKMLNPKAVLTIESGTFTGNGNNKALIKNDDYGTCIINGGEYSGAYWAVQNNNEMVINDGVFEGTKTKYGTQDLTYPGGVVRNIGYGTNGDQGDLKIYGGTFKALIDDTYVLDTRRAGSTVVYDGSYTGQLRETAENTSFTPALTIYNGTFKYVNGNVNYDVNSCLAKGSAYSYRTFEVTGNKGIVDLTKYVLYESTPKDTKFTYTISNMGGTEGAVYQASSSDSVTAVYYGMSPTSVKFTNTGTNTGELNFDVNDFNNGATTKNLAAEGITEETDEHLYASKSFKLDFTGIAFDNPGIYRYVLTETSNNSYIPASSPLYIDVWVNRAGTDPVGDATNYNTCVVAGVVAHTAQKLTITNSSSVADKVSYLKSVSTQKSLNLTMKQTASGNQASKLESYSYAINFTGGTPNAKITYKKNSGDITSIQLDNNGAASYTFDLLDGDSVVFKCLSEGTGYSAKISDESKAKMKSLGLSTGVYIEKDNSTGTETDSDVVSDDGATNTRIGTTADIKDLNTSTSVYEIADTHLSANTTVDFKIYKQGAIPTGIIMNVAPYAIALLAGAFGLIIFVIKRREHDEEEA